MQRILVGLDGSSLAEAILDPVRALAKHLGAEVVLLHVTHVPETVRALETGRTLDEIVVQERERAQTYLDGMARRLSAAGVAARTKVSAGETAVEIVRCADRERIDLIALSTHGRSGIQRWLYGSVADGVLHTTKTPLLLLRPAGTGAAATPAPRRLLVPLDGSAVAEAAVPMAEELARSLGAPILLLRAVEVTDFAFGAERFGSPYVYYQGIFDTLRDEAERYLDRLAVGLRGKGLTVETRVCIGMPVDAITARAGEHAGTVIVMSTHGRSGWRAAVLGSVARRVVALASTPVLVVQSTDAPGVR